MRRLSRIRERPRARTRKIPQNFPHPLWGIAEAQAARGFPSLELLDDDGPAGRQRQPVGVRFKTRQSVEHPLLRTRRKADGNQLPAAERFEQAFGRLERSDLRADGKGRPLVGSPEKPLAVENDAVGVLRLGTYEIFARHGSKSYLDRRFYRFLHSRFPNRKIFSTDFAGKQPLRLQAAGNKSNQSDESEVASRLFLDGTHREAAGAGAVAQRGDVYRSEVQHKAVVRR